MKAEELRIGNFYDHNGFVNEVHPNTIEEVWISERSWVKPIPLTEEWLIKFGFKNGVLPGYEKFPIDRVGGNSKSFCFGSGDIYKTLKYVHELQNIWFAVFNEELTLKP